MRWAQCTNAYPHISSSAFNQEKHASPPNALRRVRQHLSLSFHHSQQLAVLHHHRPSYIKRRRLASRPLHARRRCQKADSALALTAHLLGPCRVTDSTLKQQQRHILARWAQEQQGEQQRQQRRRQCTHPTPAAGGSSLSSGSPVHKQQTLSHMKARMIRIIPPPPPPSRRPARPIAIYPH
jgi:hypothetical protein